MNSPRLKKMPVPLALTWNHCDTLYRVTPWPEVRFERVCGDAWLPIAPTDDVFAAAARSLDAREWEPYLEFTPPTVRELVSRFSMQRMQALQVAARCPALLTALIETPALVPFLAAHERLRGTGAARWEEINAVNERGGIFGVLEWLGLPASRQTLSIVHAIADPELPKHFLEPLRTQLWEPRTAFALQQLPAISDRQLASTCHALAA